CETLPSGGGGGVGGAGGEGGAEGGVGGDAGGAGGGEVGGDGGVGGVVGGEQGAVGGGGKDRVASLLRLRPVRPRRIICPALSRNNRSPTHLTIIFTHQMRHLSRLIRSNTHPNTTTIQLRQVKCTRADRAMRQIQHLDRAFRTQKVAVMMIANLVVDALHDEAQHWVGTCGKISDYGVTALPAKTVHRAAFTAACLM